MMAILKLIYLLATDGELKTLSGRSALFKRLATSTETKRVHKTVHICVQALLPKLRWLPLWQDWMIVTSRTARNSLSSSQQHNHKMIDLIMTMTSMTITAQTKNMMHKIVLLCFCFCSARTSCLTPSSTLVATCKPVLSGQGCSLLEHARRSILLKPCLTCRTY